MNGTLLGKIEAEVRDLALDIVNEEGLNSTAAAEAALTTLPIRWTDPDFVKWLSGGTLALVNGKVRRVR